MGADARAAGWPLNISRALIGSCTNSSYEDITRTADLARQARAAGLRVKTPLLVSPGSQRIHDTMTRDGLLVDLEAIGATVLANACGPCIGQWTRDDVVEGDVNVIINSYNRNFPKRNDGFASTLSFVTSPETVMAYALAGTLDFNPLTDDIDGVKLEAPHGEELPAKGYEPGGSGFQAPPADGSTLTVVVRPDSDRLHVLEPFPAWDGQDYVQLPVLLKAKGKCTTDHISAAGKWLTYRGHLENISGNLFLGVVNAPATPARAATRSTARPARSPTSPSTCPAPGCPGWRSATTTTARAPAANTRPWSRVTAAVWPSWPAASPAFTTPISRSRASCRSRSPTRRRMTTSSRTTRSPSSAWRRWPPTPR
jgi:aconitase A